MTTVAQYVAGPWQVHFATMKPSTRTRVSWCLNRVLLPAFGGRDIASLTGPDVVRWYEARARTRPGCANRSLDVLRQICTHAGEQGVRVEENPCAQVVRVRLRRRTRYLTRAELDRVYRELRRMAPRGPQGRGQIVIIRLLLLTGARVGEICGLRWADIQGDTLRLRDSKTGPRTVWLSDAAVAVLATHRERDGCESPWVFPGRHGGARSRELSTWRLVRRRAGVQDVRLHDLRHTFASHAAMAGVPLPVLSRLLGHASIAMTMRYAHVGDRETAAAAERIGEAIAGWMEAA